MVIDSKEIDVFNNLSEFDLDNVYYDLHNDFNCVKVEFESDILILFFENIANMYLVSIRFQNAILTLCEFDFDQKIESLTIDNLYRGKFEINGKLIEFDNNKGYFYLEFYEGQKIEFWSESMDVEKIESC
jgi:hypothetical protein